MKCNASSLIETEVIEAVNLLYISDIIPVTNISQQIA
jgi:hypothetical protein